MLAYRQGFLQTVMRVKFVIPDFCVATSHVCVLHTSHACKPDLEQVKC